MDFTPYSFCFDGRIPPMSMDKRHIEALHDLVMGVPMGGIAVEVGSHKGASTSAFIEAINRGRNFQLHVVEPRPTPELLRVISLCREPGLVVLHKTTSETFRLPHCDLWFIDGDHGWPAVADCMNALVSDSTVIALHDTRAYLMGIQECFGAYLAAEALQADHSRIWDEDAVTRPGEWTHRGFGVSTKR